MTEEPNILEAVLAWHKAHDLPPANHVDGLQSFPVGRFNVDINGHGEEHDGLPGFHARVMLENGVVIGVANPFANAPIFGECREFCDFVAAATKGGEA